MRLKAQLKWGWWEASQNVLFEQNVSSSIEPFAATLYLFRRDDEAIANGASFAQPNEVWDLESSGPPAAGTISYDVYAPGVYLVLALASPAAYSRQGSFSLEVRNEATLFQMAPGNIRLWIYYGDGHPAGRVQVALSSVVGFTDDWGSVQLIQVPAGTHVIKLGPNGTGRPPYGRPDVEVYAGVFSGFAEAPVSAADYAAWTGQAVD